MLNSFRRSKTPNSADRHSPPNVEIIRSVHDLRFNSAKSPDLRGAQSMDDVRIWRKPGDDEMVSPLSVTTSGKEHHIDIYEDSEVQPPSYLNVKDVDQQFNPKYNHSHPDSGRSKSNHPDHQSPESNPHPELNHHPERPELNPRPAFRPPHSEPEEEVTEDLTVTSAYCLSRSKSVCDLRSFRFERCSPERSSVYDSAERSTSVFDSAERSTDRRSPRAKHVLTTLTSEASSTASRSRIVRNRTILGSFPLFYKLSQSLSSLNTRTTTETTCAQFVQEEQDR